MNSQFKDHEETLFTTLPSDTFDRVAAFTKHAQLAQHEKSKTRHLGKFERLKDKSRADLDLDWRKKDNTLDTESLKHLFKSSLSVFGIDSSSIIFFFRIFEKYPTRYSRRAFRTDNLPG